MTQGKTILIRSKGTILTTQSSQSQPPTAGRTNRRVWAARILLGLAFAVLLVFQARSMLLFFSHGWSAITFPFPLDYGEGPLLDQTMRLLRFENIYRSDLSTPPYTISNYPPLFVALQTPFAALIGPSFVYGRAISFISVVVAAACIGLTIHALTKDWIGGVAGGLTLLAIPYMLNWAPLNRIDSLALGLSWVGLFIIARWPAARWSLVASALLLVAAIFTRQTYALAAPFAAFIWLLSHPPRRRAFVFAGIIAGVSLALFGLLMLLTSGGFYFNVVTSNVNPFYWGQVNERVTELATYALYLTIIGWIFLLLGPVMRARSWWLVGPYLLGGVLSAVTIGKAGSNVNYLFELSAALSLAVGVVIAVPRHVLLRAAPLLLLAWQVNGLYAWTLESYYGRVMDKVAARDSIAALQQRIHEAKGPVLADEYMGLLPLDGRPILIQPFEIKQLADAGIWDEQPFLGAIERKEFALIALYELPNGYELYRDRWTDTMLTTIYYNYRFVDKVADCYIFEPLP